MRKKGLVTRTLSMTLAISMVMGSGCLDGWQNQDSTIYAAQVNETTLEEGENVVSDNAIETENADVTEEVPETQEAEDTDETAETDKSDEAKDIEKPNQTIPLETVTVNRKELGFDKASELPSGTELMSSHMPDTKLLTAVVAVMNAYTGSDTYTADTLTVNAFSSYTGTLDFSSYEGASEIQSIQGLGIARNATEFQLGACTNVTQIPESEFTNCAQVVKITLPSTITQIGASAFNGCAKLAKLDVQAGESTTEDSLPTALTNVGARAFLGTALVKITLNAKDARAYQYADLMFSGCSALEEITISKSVGTLPVQAFGDCGKLKTVTIEADSNLDRISANAFAEDKALTNLDFSMCAKLNAIETRAFANCTALEEIILPTTITGKMTWGDEICINNENLVKMSANTSTGLVIPDYVSSMGTGCFSGAVALESAVIPATFKVIAPATFSGCKKLSSVTVNNVGATELGSLETIGAQAFYTCESLSDTAVEEILTNNQITTIGDEAFYQCLAITKLTLPESLYQIGAKAFYCPREEKKSNTEHDKYAAKEKIVSQLGSVEWKSSTNKVAERKIGAEAFFGNTELVTVALPQNSGEKLYIGASAFGDNEKLTTVKTYGQSDAVLPNTVTEIADYAFSYCYALEEIALSTTPANSELVLGSGVFYADKSLTTVTLPQQITEIPKLCFAEAGVTNLIIGSTANKIVSELTKIGEKAFYGCQIETLDLSGCTKLNEIAKRAFAGIEVNTNDTFTEAVLDSKLKKLILPASLDGTLDLGAEIFRGADNFTTLAAGSNDKTGTAYIPDYISSMNSGIFANTAVSDARIPKSFTSLPEATFSGSRINDLDFLQDTELVTLGDKCFAQCMDLTKVDLKQNTKITSIGKLCFAMCPNLISTEKSPMTLPVNIQSLGDYAFAKWKIFNEAQKDSDLRYSNFIYLDLSGYASLTTMGTAVFGGIDSLQTVKLPENVKRLGNYTFYYATALESVDFNRADLKLEEIGTYCFEHCISLGSNSKVIFGEQLKKISTNAFKECYNLTQVQFNSNLETIDVSAFAYTGAAFDEPALMVANSKELTFDFSNATSLKTIGANAFQYSGVKSIDLSKATALTNINSTNIFNGCIYLDNISFGKNVSYIGTGVLSGCPSLNTINIYNLTTLHEGVLNGMANRYKDTDAALDTSNRYTHQGKSTGFTINVKPVEEALQIPYDEEVSFPYKVGAKAVYDYVALGTKGADSNYTVEDVCVELKGVNAFYLNNKDGDNTYLLDAAHAGAGHDYYTAADEPYTEKGGNNIDVPVFKIKGYKLTEENCSLFGYCDHTFTLTGNTTLTANANFQYDIKVVESNYRPNLYEKRVSNTLSEPVSSKEQFQVTSNVRALQVYYAFQYEQEGLDDSKITEKNVVVVSDNPSVLYPGKNATDKTGQSGTMTTSITNSNASYRNFYLIPAGIGTANITVYPADHVGEERYANTYTYTVNCDLQSISVALPTTVKSLTPGESAKLSVTVTNILGKKGTLNAISELSSYTNNKLILSSENPEYLKVDQDGTITAIKADNANKTVKIVAKYINSLGKETLGQTVVTVKLPEIVAGNTYTDPATNAEVKVIAKGNGNGTGTVEYLPNPGFSGTTLVIPETVMINGITYKVTKIADNAFKNNKKLKTVTIPDTVMEIGKSAFDGCTKMTKITIGKGVRSIGAKAFYNCKKLKTIRIKSNVLTSVGKNCFKKIYKKATIKVPKAQLVSYRKLLSKKGQSSKVKIKK